MRYAVSVLGMLLASAVVVGCGGSEEGFSGVTLDSRVGELSDDDMHALCTWVIGQQGGEGAMHDCGGGLSVTLDTVNECVAEQGDYSDCTLTVAQMEDCVLDAGANPCQAPSTPACEPLGACLFGP